MSTLIQFKRVNSDEVFSDSEYIPEAGEPVFNLLTNRLYVGDGVKKVSELDHIGGLNINIASLNILTSYMESGALNTYYEKYLNCDVEGLVKWEIQSVKVIDDEINNPDERWSGAGAFERATGFEYYGGDVTEISRLPNGMSFEAYTGKFSGTPIETGRWYLTIRASYLTLSDTKIFEWSVN